jgi:hypothetical protein
MPKVLDCQGLELRGPRKITRKISLRLKVLPDDAEMTVCEVIHGGDPEEVPATFGNVEREDPMTVGGDRGYGVQAVGNTVGDRRSRRS